MIEYYAAENFGEMFIGAGIFIILVTFAIYFIKKFAPSYSYSYRKYLTNLYVCGRIKQLAEKDKVNLTEIDLEVTKYIKQNNKQRIRDLDDKIEQDLINSLDKESESKKSIEKKE